MRVLRNILGENKVRKMEERETASSEIAVISSSAKFGSSNA